MHLNYYCFGSSTCLEVLLVTGKMIKIRHSGQEHAYILHSMADLVKEATTVRRVFEPIFHYFDNGNHWSPEKGIAQSVLYDMQLWMEKSGIDGILPVFFPMGLESSY